MLLAFAGAASAVITRHPESFSPLTGAGSGVTLAAYNQSGVTVDEATGDVFVSDAENGIVILGGEGGAPAGLASPFAIPSTNFFSNAVTARAFLAYDNSASSPAKGTLYAYDPDTEGIKRYQRDGGSEQYVEVVGEFHAPGCGTGSAGGGIDSAGDVYLGCIGLDKLYELSPAGVVLHEYDLAGTPVSRPSQVAVDSAGDVFVQADLGALYKFPVSLAGEIEPLRYEQVAVEATGVAYEPKANEIIVGETGRIEEYNATTLAKIGEFGNEVLYSTRAERVTVNTVTHRVYATTYEEGVSGNGVLVFGPEVIEPTLRATAASNVTGTKATLNGSVNPEGLEVTECFFEYGETTAYASTAPCEGSIATNDEAQPVSASITGLTPNGATYHYRLVATNENGTEKSADKTLATADTVVTEAASGVTSNSATLNGYVRPEGLQYSGCAFEYKLTTEVAYGEASCGPTATEIEPDFSAHAVAATLSKLRPNSAYQYRLRATNTEGVKYGQVLSLTTTGSPQISEIRARDATEDAAVIEAKINPSGYTTRYRFEWGPTSSYGNTVPAEFEPSIGAGEEPVLVTAKLTALTPGAVYHYRVVASNTLGGRSTTESPDQTLETLDSCGMPDGRCLEMVSPREPGPAAQPGQFVSNKQLHFQAAESPGSLAYVIEAGLPNSTRGAEVLYQSVRGGEGWQSTQISSGVIGQNERTENIAFPSRVAALSPNLGCAVEESDQPLTSDPVARLTIEAGGNNLYRRNPDGSYTLINDLPNIGLEVKGANEYRVVGMASDCSRIVFEDPYHYHYSGVPGGKLYEWTEEGGIKNVGFVPSGGGEEAPEEGVGGSNTAGVNDYYHAVSTDGSRVFFSATRLVGSDPGEVGTTGVFVRIDGSHTEDVSLSQTSTPDTGATFQGATPDGSRVYFIANAGLTSESNASGADLYEYNLETEMLTDLSVGDGEDIAEVDGLIGVANDGSHVYFVARGQLVPGGGGTLAKNEASETYSIYDASGGGLHYVGAIGNGFNELSATTLLSGEQSKTSRVSVDGRYLLFESSLDLTGYDSKGFREVFLYDAQGGSEPLVCISCRQDGTPPVNPTTVGEHLESGGNTNVLYEPLSLVVRDGNPEVFFVSRDRLAEGANEDAWNLYEWAHGQVFHIADEVPGTVGPQYSAGLRFAGASADGTDIYFFDGAPLNWEDPQGRNAAWDARIDGGFAEPAPEHRCEAASEGSERCQAPSSQSSALGTPGSLSFVGPSNATPKSGSIAAKRGKSKQHRQKGKRKRKNKHKKKGKRKKTNARGRQMRHASGNRGAAK
jgi:hypothetical protein